MHSKDVDNKTSLLLEDEKARAEDRSQLASSIPRARNRRGNEELSGNVAAPSGARSAKDNGKGIWDPSFLIDLILPSREVHILGGPSGAGKTRWLFQMLEQWKAGNPVLGYKSNPVPYVYVSTDRSLASVKRTCEDLDIDPNQLPIIAAVEKEPSETGYTVSWLFDLVMKEFPGAKLIVVEGLGGFVPGGKVNEYAPVAKFLRSLTRECQRRRITVLGVHHTSKSKENEGYGNPREKLLGSAAWSAYCETIFVLDFFKSSEVKNHYRVLNILPRNHAPNMQRFYRVDQEQRGRLVETAKPAEPKSPGGRPRLPNAAVDKYLAAKEEEGAETFSLKEAAVSLVNDDFSESTLRRRLDDLCEQGKLEKTEDGNFRILLSVMQLLGGP